MLITSRDNPTVKLAAKLLSSTKARHESGCFIAEGIRLCRDAVESESEIKCFLYTAEAAQKYHEDFILVSSQSEASYELSTSLYNKLSNTNTPQGFMCIISKNTKNIMKSIVAGKRYAALENIQDPSNLGTILRTCEALGADGVILSSDCCDIYSPKVVRGSMGAVFRLPFMIVRDFRKFITNSVSDGIICYASTPYDAYDIEDVDFSGGGIMLIGNEGNGLRDDTIKACNQRVRIRMNGRAESLNASAAAAILIYRFII